MIDDDKDRGTGRTHSMLMQACMEVRAGRAVLLVVSNSTFYRNVVQPVLKKELPSVEKHQGTLTVFYAQDALNELGHLAGMRFERVFTDHAAEHGLSERDLGLVRQAQYGFLRHVTNTFTIHSGGDPSKVARSVVDALAKQRMKKVDFGLEVPDDKPCDHSFIREQDGLTCQVPGCRVVISGQQLDALGPNRYDMERTRLADRCGTLETELKDVKAENCDLRREVERLRRKR